MASRSIVVLIVVLLLAPPALGELPPLKRAGWSGNGFKEPDTLEDVLDGFMWTEPENGTDPSYHRVYFSAFHVAARSINPNSALIGSNVMTPMTSFDALLGIWKDCNNDGFIGLAESALYEYRSELLIDQSICPSRGIDGAGQRPPLEHNWGMVVSEFLPIGPACGHPKTQQMNCLLSDPKVFVDNETLVWGDTGKPGQAPSWKCPKVLVSEDVATSVNQIEYGRCVLVLAENAQPNTFHTRCDALAKGVELCAQDAPPSSNQTLPDYAIIFNCDLPLTSRRSVGTLEVANLSTYGVQQTHLALLDADPYTYAAAAPVGCLTTSTSSSYTIFSQATDSAADFFAKRAPDWDFRFISSSVPFYGGLGPLNEGGLHSIWHGTMSDFAWENRYLDLTWNGMAEPKGSTYFSFFAHVGSNIRSSGVKLPSSSFQTYSSEACSAGMYEGIGVWNGWDCDPSHWHRNAQGQDIRLPWQAPLLTTTYLKDIDCYDGSTLAVGPSTSSVWPMLDEYVADGLLLGEYGENQIVCPRPDTVHDWMNYYTTYAGAQIDANRNSVGDTYERAYGIAWNALEGQTDFDNDYTPPTRRAGAITEFRWDTNPHDPDTDDDGWMDADEISYWDARPDGWQRINWQDAIAMTYGVALRDPDSHLDTDRDGLNNTRDRDSDNDTWSDGDEYFTYRTYPEFPDSDCAMDANGYSGACSQVASANTSVARQGAPGTGENLGDATERREWLKVDPSGRILFDDIDRDGIANALLDPDVDGDALNDSMELSCELLCGSPINFDTDRDGLLDGTDLLLATSDPRLPRFQSANVYFTRESTGKYRFYGEATALTDPYRWDSDGDSLPDGWEVKDGLPPNVTNSQSDADGLSDYEEYCYPTGSPCAAPGVWWQGTNPVLADTDGDLLLDHLEVSGESCRSIKTDPRKPDHDLDGLSDQEECGPANKSDPTKIHMDDDGLTDYQEVSTYPHLNLDPSMNNTDGNQYPLDPDRWTDYQEVIQFKTRPDNWDRMVIEFRTPAMLGPHLRRSRQSVSSDL